MIDLNKFTESTEGLVPVIENKFQYNRKKYTTDYAVENGWYNVAIQGNSATIKEPVMIEIQDMSACKRIKGYTYNNNFIPMNFNVGEKLAGIELMTGLLLNQMPTFSAIEAILWEDKKLYYYKPHYADVFIHEVKSICDRNAKIENVRGMTPELKTLYLFHDLEKTRIREEAERLKKQQEIEEFKKTLRGRLMLTFARVGAEILNYSISGNRITVDWKLQATGRRFNSVIEADTFKIIEAGYCMSGEDKKHNVHSMVKLAEVYEEDDLIYKTRE